MKTHYCLALLVIATSCTQTTKEFDPSKLAVKWEFVKNNYDGKGHFLAALTFKSDSEIPASGWQIFFNLRYHTINLESRTKGLKIEEVNGELFTITPTNEFTATKSFKLEYTGGRRIANFQDAPSGFFFVSDDNKDVAVEFTRTIEEPKALDIPSAIKYDDVADIPNPVKVLPTPVSYKEQPGVFTITDQTTIKSDFDTKYFVGEIEKVTGYKLKEGAGGISVKKAEGPAESYTLSVSTKGINITAADEAGAFYAIQSLKQLFPIDSWSKKYESIAIDNIDIKDAPRFPVREFMLDVGRNFESKKNILRLLEVMSLYKLNKFHFHFNDDEGWRLQIPGLPELTDIGAERGYPYQSNDRLQPAYGSGPTGNNHFGTGYYTREDFIEILRYATERHITVIPEIESPGHARAAIKAMDSRYDRLMREGNADEAARYLLADPNDQSTYSGAQYFKDNVMNPALPSTYTFIDKVITELKKMYEEANAPLSLVHMGGDEVAKGAWENSPLIDAYKKANPSIKTSKDLYADFFVRTNALLKKHNLKITGWEEMIIQDPHEDATARQVIDNKEYHEANLQFDAWWDIQNGYDMCYPIANAGYGVVLTPFDFFYFDLPQSPGFNEPGDAWIGYLDIKKTFSFVPFDIYKSYPLDYQLKTIDAKRFKNKAKLTEAGKKNIRGIQAALWAENMTFDGYMEYQVLPRLLAMAERSWSPDPVWSTETGKKHDEDFNADWGMFLNKLKKRELPRLDHYNGGYKYYRP